MKTHPRYGRPLLGLLLVVISCGFDRCHKDEAPYEPKFDKVGAVTTSAKRVYDASDDASDDKPHPGRTVTIEWTGESKFGTPQCQEYQCTLTVSDGSKVTLSMYTMGLQGRNFPVWIEQVSGVTIWKQQNRSLVEADHHMTSTLRKSVSVWDVPAAGIQSKTGANGEHPPKLETIDFIEFTGTCTLKVYVHRLLHSPMEDAGRTRIKSHETAPPPPEGGGQDGDNNGQNAP